MGNSRWDENEYRSYAKSSSYVTKSRAEVFSSRRLDSSLDPKNITLRESRDSASNPNSTPIILGLDVTGSMGIYAEKIAKTYLPQLMSGIIECQPVSDPHIMFMGIGDVRAHDQAPLQVSQFEADIKILESLLKIYLEGNGGGNQNESYDLAWYFAINNTDIDSLNKRGKKGFLFTFGDEFPPEDALTSSQLRGIFGHNDLPVYDSMAEQLEEVRKKYHVFHIIIEQGSFCRSKGQQVIGKWKELLGDFALPIKDVEDLPELIMNAMRLAEGADVNEILNESKNSHAMKYSLGL